MYGGLFVIVARFPRLFSKELGYARGTRGVKYRKLPLCYWSTNEKRESLGTMTNRPDCGAPREVLARFPKSGTAIRKLFSEDEAFHELCSDYAECLAVLARLRRGQGAADARIEQYCELRVNIEQELQVRISASTAGSAGSRQEKEPLR